MGKSPERPGPPSSLTSGPYTYRIDGEAVPGVTRLAAIFGLPPEQDDALRTYIGRRLSGAGRGRLPPPGDCRPWAGSVERFLSEHRLVPIPLNVPLRCEARGVRFAGTPDFLGSFDGHLSILEWTCASRMQKTMTGARLSGYWELCAANDIFPEALYGVQFLPDGVYRIYPAGMKADDLFLCLDVYRAVHRKHPEGAIQ